MNDIDPWFIQHLVCPVDQLELAAGAGKLFCSSGHNYPVFEGIPVMLVRSKKPTQEHAVEKTMSLIDTDNKAGSGRGSPAARGTVVDDFVQRAVAATNSNLYRRAVGRLRRYPIPVLDLPLGSGKLFLDIGSNWGRWCIAASRLGYTAIGIDPSLEAVLAARRVAAQLGAKSRYLVADARFLPFHEDLFDTVYSYSVFQHFDKDDVRAALGEIGRVLRPGGVSVIQMLNCFGLRNLFVQLQRRFRRPGGFETRYWRPGEMRRAFGECIGPSHVRVGSFFTQGQPPDLDLFAWRHRSIVRASEMLKRLNGPDGSLRAFADNVLVCSRKDGSGESGQA